MYQFISFYLGHEHYALDILLVKEIGRLIEISPVPESPAHLLGIMNLRGQILTVVDPQFFLDQQSVNAQEERTLIILKNKQELQRISKLNRKVAMSDFSVKDPLALLVDGMGETLTIDSNKILPPLPNIAIEKREFIEGIIHKDNHFIIIIALDALLKRIINDTL